MKKLILFMGAVAFAGIAHATTWNVTVENGQFTPKNLMNVKVGDMVVWTFNESGHTTASGSSCTKDGKWDSGAKGNGETFSHTFTSVGEYPYFCEPHCSSGMTGLIAVSTGTTGIQAETDRKPESGFENYPNPFIGSTTFTFYSEKPSNGILQIYSLDGKSLATIEMTVTKGRNSIPLHVDLAKGTFIARLNLEAALPKYKLIVKQ